MSAVTKQGKWSAGAKFLGETDGKTNQALKFAILGEALETEKDIKEGIKSGSPGGKTFKKLSELTLAKRKAKGIRGTKPLIRRGDLRRSVRTTFKSDGFFVGVLKTARGSDGQSMFNVAKIQENGQQMILDVDKAGKGGKTVRSFFMALFLQGFIDKPLKKSTTFLIVQIPPRPFIGPVFKKRNQGRGARLIKSMGLKTGLSVV